MTPSPLGFAMTPPGVQGVPLGMSKIRSRYLAPDFSATRVFLRQEPDDEEEEEDDDSEEDDDDKEEDDDEGYSP